MKSRNLWLITYPNAQIHCVFSTRARHASFPDALLEKLSLYLIGIGHNQSLPIPCARATAQYVHLLIAVPRDVTLARAMLLVKAEFFTLAAKTPVNALAPEERPNPQRQVFASVVSPRIAQGSGRNVATICPWPDRIESQNKTADIRSSLRLSATNL